MDNKERRSFSHSCLLHLQHNPCDQRIVRGSCRRGAGFGIFEIRKFKLESNEDNGNRLQNLVEHIAGLRRRAWFLQIYVTRVGKPCNLAG